MDLGQLIEQVKEDRRLSYKALAARSGGVLSTSNVNSIVLRGLTDPPETRTIRALIAALEVPDHLLWDALGLTLGFDIPEDDGWERNQMLDIPARLPDAAFEEIRRYARVIIELWKTRQRDADLEAAITPARRTATS